MNLTGTWKGFYEYGMGIHPPVFSERISFMMQLIENEEGFIGTCEDEDHAFAIPEVAEIEGFTEDTFISFTKRYPNYYEIQPDGSFSKDETRTLEIQYEGNFHPGTGVLYGRWDIDLGTFTEDGLQYQLLQSGIWQMRKV